MQVQFKTVNSEAVQRTKTSEIKENKNMAGQPKASHKHANNGTPVFLLPTNNGEQNNSDMIYHPVLYIFIILDECGIEIHDRDM